MRLGDQVCSWKPIPGFDGLYEVSDNGLVRSIKRSGAVGGLLKQHPYKGYLQVWLSKQNKVRRLSVHRAVLMAFDRLPLDQEVCNHKDGNRTNNSIMNLEWCSRAENEAHKKCALGQDGKGEKNANYGYRHAKLYPSNTLRNRLCELGIPRYRHNLAELGEILPQFIQEGFLNSYRLRDSGRWCVAYETLKVVTHGDDISGHSDRYWVEYPKVDGDTEADARAKMLIYLIENNLIDFNGLITTYPQVKP